MTTILYDEFSKYDNTNTGNWVISVAGTVDFQPGKVVLGGADFGEITNTTDALTSLLNKTIEYSFSVADLTETQFIIYLYDGTYRLTIITNAYTGTANIGLNGIYGNYVLPSIDEKVYVRVTIDSNGIAKAYVNNVLIPNSTSGIIPDSTSKKIYIINGISSSDIVTIYSLKICDQEISPSDPIPNTSYSGGTLYCTNDDVRRAGGTIYYKTENITDKTGYTVNLLIQQGYKIFELDKYTDASGKITQLIQVSHSPTAGQFCFTPPNKIKLGDSLQASDRLDITYQTSYTDEQINKRRQEIQHMIDVEIANRVSPPLVPGVSLYDQIIDICANLTKLSLIKNTYLGNKDQSIEIKVQWDYYMSKLRKLGNVTINGILTNITNTIMPERVNYQATVYNDDYQRELDMINNPPRN